MARRTLLAAVLTGAIVALPCAADAAVASPFAVVQNITEQFVGQPGYSGMQSFAVFVPFTSFQDRLISTSNWNVTQYASSCMVNADPVADDPLGLIDDADGGDVPIASSILSQTGYGVWRWDTNLSVDNSPLSQAQLGTMISPTHIKGGASVPPPGIAAGPDLVVQVAQITTVGLDYCHSGTFSVTYQSASSQVAQTATMVTGCLHTDRPGDLSADGLVNSIDLAILLSNWSIPARSPGCGGGTCCRSDLNQDGFVNSLDLGILLSDWYDF